MFFTFETVEEQVAQLKRHMPEEQARELITGPTFFLGLFVSPENALYEEENTPIVVLPDESERTANAPAMQLNKTAAHELFGHALLYLRGEPSAHDDGGPVDTRIREIEDRTK